MLIKSSLSRSWLGDSVADLKRSKDPLQMADIVWQFLEIYHHRNRLVEGVEEAVEKAIDQIARIEDFGGMDMGEGEIEDWLRVLWLGSSIIDGSLRKESQSYIEEYEQLGIVPDLHNY